MEVISKNKIEAIRHNDENIGGLLNFHPDIYIKGRSVYLKIKSPWWHCSKDKYIKIEPFYWVVKIAGKLIILDADEFKKNFKEEQ